MPKQKREEQLGETRELSPGVKLLRTLEGHEDVIFSLAFDPEGKTLTGHGVDQ